MSLRPRTLRGRLALWYAGVLSVVLVAFSVTVYLIVTDEEEIHDAREAEQEKEEAERVLIALAVGLPLGIALSFIGGIWITKRGLAPLGEVAGVASQLGADSLGRRLPSRPSAGLEVAQLVDALNAMLERLDRSVAGLRQFTADASHELRTPISVLLGEVELSLRQPHVDDEQRRTMERVHEGLAALARLTESLLTLARSDAGELSLQAVPVGVRAILEQVAAMYAPFAADRGIRLRVREHADLEVVAEPLWLARALANLVDNACKFNGPGGEILLGAEPSGDKVLLCVDDSGTGLAPGQEARVFERFYRAADVRGTTVGFGLGLAIAREVVRGMGGDLRFEPKESPGARFVIELRSTHV